ncbi:MAG: methyltransferase domain-containing protein [Burkholderiales bacterium]|nr:MAG: methyltransferase domain-containing protein [Burkholderiales bacterium]
MKRVLNVGGNSKAIPLPAPYADFEHLLLDIDPTGQPDIVCDARQLQTLATDQFDAIYCSHNLEHYYHHDVSKVLAGFRHVLKPDGFAHIRVPDVGAVMKACVERGLDIEDVLYQSSLGPISVLDVLYGYGKQIESSGVEFFAHKTGFTQKSLSRALVAAGFNRIYCTADNLEVTAWAFNGTPSPEICARFNLAA